MTVRFGRINNSNRPYLEVAIVAQGISLEAAERIFEPFFTAGDGGTARLIHRTRTGALQPRSVALRTPPRRW